MTRCVLCGVLNAMRIRICADYAEVVNINKMAENPTGSLLVVSIWVYDVHKCTQENKTANADSLVTITQSSTTSSRDYRIFSDPILSHFSYKIAPHFE